MLRIDANDAAVKPDASEDDTAAIASVKVKNCCSALLSQKEY